MGDRLPLTQGVACASDIGALGDAAGSMARASGQRSSTWSR